MIFEPKRGSRLIAKSFKKNVFQCIETLLNGDVQGPRSKFSSGGAKEECVKAIFFFHIFSDVVIGSENSHH